MCFLRHEYSIEMLAQVSHISIKRKINGTCEICGDENVMQKSQRSRKSFLIKSISALNKQEKSTSRWNPHRPCSKKLSDQKEEMENERRICFLIDWMNSEFCVLRNYSRQEIQNCLISGWWPYEENFVKIILIFLAVLWSQCKNVKCQMVIEKICITMYVRMVVALFSI